MSKPPKRGGFLNWLNKHIKAFDISAPKATDVLNFKGEEYF